MQKWEQIEDKINEMLVNLISGSGKLISRKTPDKVKESVRKTNQNIKNKIKNNSTTIKTTIVDRSKKTFTKAKDFTQTSKVTIQKAKEDSMEEIRDKGLLVAFALLVTPLLLSLKNWLGSLKSSTIVSFVTITTIATLTGLNIYTQSQKIAEERAKEAELVEEVEGARAVSSRPTYHKKEERTFIVYDIVLPAYFEQSKMSKLVIDFSIESSNKYIKTFFLENPHYVNDVLNSSIEPVSVDFPLEEEGKIIIKDKIRLELNNLLKELKIKGEITEVNIHKIVGG